ncbi:MAG: SIMPL domain-containing protein [Pyrinomonadaceae bacterium MAG19_C2-C3]|nr:SIMPL domain-containing protein [Pyrinomonadaceae bacterium MAG19_C2-C3]
MKNLKTIGAIWCLMLMMCAASSGVAAQTQPQNLTLRGRLAPTVEANGWVINAAKGKYLLLNFARFQNEAWFREGTEVEATGETKPGTITIYQEGTPFEARVMRSVEGSAGNNPTNQNPDNRDLAASVRTTQVIVAGDSIVQAQPDTAIITVAVITQNRSALTAQQQNAEKTEAVVRAVRAAAGAGAEIKTSGYSLQPQRVYKENQPPTISGYEARNGVTVTMPDLNRVGSVIDAASSAGANSVDNLAFTLRRDRPARDQALREATTEAVAKANTLAQVLGGRVIRIVQVQEEGTVRPLPIQRYDTAEFGIARASTPTPIETGTLDITSRVQLVAEIGTN